MNRNHWLIVLAFVVLFIFAWKFTSCFRPQPAPTSTEQKQ